MYDFSLVLFHSSRRDLSNDTNDIIIEVLMYGQDHFFFSLSSFLFIICEQIIILSKEKKSFLKDKKYFFKMKKKP